jgi:hypothetical protein
MNQQENQPWNNLAAMAAPAYAAADDAPPYGFTTRVLAQLGSEQRQQKSMERIGLRAIFASLAILVLTGVVALGLNHSRNNGDLEPGLGRFVQAADMSLS